MYKIHRNKICIRDLGSSSCSIPQWKGNTPNLIMSFMAPSILNVSKTSKKLTTWALGSSSWNPSNYTNYWTIWIMFNLISKLLAITIGLTMLDSTPIKDGLAYLNVVLYGSAIFFDYMSSNLTPTSSALRLILALRFQKAIRSIFGSSTNRSNKLLLVINQQI